MASSGIWRPPQWAPGRPAMVSITVPSSANGQAQVSSDGQGNFVSQNQAPTTYVFDAVIELNHTQRGTKTKHPVQTGADISSHFYLEPAQLSLSVGMSDAMDAYATGQDPTQPPYITAFTGNPSKSVSAYLTMQSLQASAVPLTITTRLRTYTNMVIIGLTPRENSRTIAGLRMIIDFEEIPLASISTSPVSARPNDTGETGLGTVNSQTPNTQITNQFNTTQASQQNSSLVDAPTSNLLSWLKANPQGVNTPGAGDYSSVNTNNLQQLPSPE